MHDQKRANGIPCKPTDLDLNQESESEGFNEEPFTENVFEPFEEIEELKKITRSKKKVKLKPKTKHKLKTELENVELTKSTNEVNVCHKCGKSFSLVFLFLEHSQKCQELNVDQLEKSCDRFLF
jgi:hypothetical protein